MSFFFKYKSCLNILKRHFSGISNDHTKVNEILKSGINNIRNFAIIAHIDHGKSTLSDRLLEYSGNLTHTATISGENAQSLDTLAVERERGITVKAQGASMFYEYNNNGYMLNLIDTPGHVDFSYEVSRSLKACQGVLLLVDSSQGIQAQTIATYEMAMLNELKIIPILTKIDLPNANPDKRAEELADVLEFDIDDVVKTSSKTGEGIDHVFEAIINKVPPPKATQDQCSRFLLYDSFWNTNRGVIAKVYVNDGYLKTQDTLSFYHSNIQCVVQEIGICMPELKPVDVLYPGQVGYFVGNIRNPNLIKIGDTLFIKEHRKHFGKDNQRQTPVLSKEEIEPLGIVQETKCMVFACLYPLSTSNHKQLEAAITQLKLTDASVSSQPISSEALGAGFRCGFLGVLHMEVFRQRLEDESNVEVLVAAPTITYRMINEHNETIDIESPEEYPSEPGKLRFAKYLQPMVRATIICPSNTSDIINELCLEHDGIEEEMSYLGSNFDRVLYRYRFPLSRIVTDFYTKIKSVTHGHGSFDYEECGWEPIDLVRVTILINRKPVGPLSVLCARDRSYEVGKSLCERLSNAIKRQLFEVDIQAAIGTKVIAKAKIKAVRKDVLMKAGKSLGTGDISRKKKLLDAQKEGKKRMKEISNVKVPQSAFMEALKA